MGSLKPGINLIDRYTVFSRLSRYGFRGAGVPLLYPSHISNRIAIQRFASTCGTKFLLRAARSAALNKNFGSISAQSAVSTHGVRSKWAWKKSKLQKLFHPRSGRNSFWGFKLSHAYLLTGGCNQSDRRIVWSN